MKKSYLALLLVGITTCVLLPMYAFSPFVHCHWGHGCTSNDKIITMEMQLPPFSKIENEMMAHIIVEQGESSKITVQAPKRLIKEINPIVKDGRLHLGKPHRYVRRRKARITLHIITTQLTDLTTNGIGNIHVISKFNSPTLFIRNDGANNITIENLKSTLFSIHNYGMGNIIAKGITDSMQIYSKGVGYIKTYSLKSNCVDIQLDGIGNIDCHASESIQCRIDGIGSITYTGDPEKIKVKSNGLGKLRHK